MAIAHSCPFVALYPTTLKEVLFIYEISLGFSLLWNKVSFKIRKSPVRGGAGDKWSDDESRHL